MIEELGTYDPMGPETDARVTLKADRIDYWVSVGAQPSDKVAVLIKKYGTDGTHLEAQKEALERLSKRKDYTPAKEAPKPAKKKKAEAEAAPAEAAAEAAPAEPAAAEESDHGPNICRSRRYHNPRQAGPNPEPGILIFYNIVGRSKSRSSPFLNVK